ncbi:MAG: peptidylprolyl isomerase [Anaerolineae bacterium]|nr:peptidylprolyl isomerase [Anaerolineae bacterium]
MAPNKIQDGLVVSVQYTLKLDDGEIIDESTADDPLLYLHGADNIIPGLERALTGMAVNETKHVTVAPADAYGEYDEDALESFPLGFFPEDLELEPGLMLDMSDENGNLFEATIVDVNDDEVLVDFNHPLAGETLHFDVKVLALREATPEELAHGHPHLPGMHAH